MYVGNNQKITATVLPEEALLKDLSWSSNNAAVATVDQAGDVTAVGTGTAIITAVSFNGTVSTCKIVVTQPVTGISLNKSNLTLSNGTTDTLTATVAPENASNKKYTWSSSDETVTKVDQSGKVIAFKTGTAIITATTEDGGKIATCKVTVKQPIINISLNKSELTLNNGDTETLIATISPENATNKNYTWESSDEAVAKVDQSGKVIALKEDTATITVITEDGNKTATCKVTVTQPSPTPTPTPTVAKQPMYRLYNPNSGEHFFTKATDERDYLHSIGWNYEGVAWTAPQISNTPVYRLYNANGGEHHYTMSASERDSLVKVGWSYEGIGWYSDDKQTTPLYRVYNPNAFSNNHHYTTSVDERDWLIGLGWRNEGIGWYGI
jgi:uncharacterized protein YjdB